MKRQRHIAWGERYGIDMDPLLPDVWGSSTATTPNDTRPPLSSFNFGGTKK